MDTLSFFPEPWSACERTEIEGMPVLLSLDLVHRDPHGARRCRAALAERLAILARDLPPGAWSRLRKVPIWLEYEDARYPGGVYFHSEQWLRDNGMNPAKAKAVQFTRTLADQLRRRPMAVLHELAHAWHDQVVGFSDPTIYAAYLRAQRLSLYEFADGTRTGAMMSTYAMTNHHEFFAVLSEAWFGECPKFPHRRAELEAHDPRSAAVIARAWARG